MKFRKKPVVVEAMRYEPDRSFKLMLWLQENHAKYDWVPTVPPLLQIWTLEGRMTARVGDWIIKGVKNEFYPCKSDVFTETYEPAE